MNDISLSHLLQLAWRRIWAIISAAVVFAACAYCYCSFISVPIYKATGSILVTNGALISQNTVDSFSTSKISSTDITASLSLADTISDILNTSDIFKQLAKETDNKYTYGRLKSIAVISRRGENTLFIDVSFRIDDRNEAIKLVNTFLNLAPDYISKYLPDSNASVTTTADATDMIYPRTSFSTMVSALLGAVLAFVVVFIIDSLDHAIKGEEDFKEKFDIPLLGTVPDFENSGITASAQGGYNDGYKE